MSKLLDAIKKYRMENPGANLQQAYKGIADQLPEIHRQEKEALRIKLAAEKKIKRAIRIINKELFKGK